MSASGPSLPIPIAFRRSELLLLGDMRETLPAAPRRGLAGAWRSPISIPGTEMSRRARRSPTKLAPLIVPLLRPDGVLVSEPAVAADRIERSAAARTGSTPGRYNLYRRISSRSSP